MPRIRKSRHLQVVVSWKNSRLKTFDVEDVIWPNEKPLRSNTEHQIIKVPLFGWASLEDYKTFFAVVQAHDLHGSEGMRAAMKGILYSFLKAAVRQKLVQKRTKKNA